MGRSSDAPLDVQYQMRDCSVLITNFAGPMNNFNILESSFFDFDYARYVRDNAKQ